MINVTIGGVSLEVFNTFPQLGSILESSANIDSEIQHRIKHVGASFAKLNSRVFDIQDVNYVTKLLQLLLTAYSQDLNPGTAADDMLKS